MPYPVATVGTVITLIAAFLADRIGVAYFKRRKAPAANFYRNRQVLSIVLTVISAGVILVLWARLFHNKGTFFGLLAAGLAVALREPLLSVAGRISISAGRMYAVGDRIELDRMAGDVIGIGFFYTRMLEIGNWMHADQATGRTVLFSNSRVYQHAVFNYTQNFAYIWDELVIPVTYASDLAEASRILIEAGKKFTEPFIQIAEQDVTRMRESYLVPNVTFQPTIFTKVTSNYVELTMRYIVDPRLRRGTNSQLYSHIFEQVQAHPAISIGSDTMDLTVHPPDKKSNPTKSDAASRETTAQGDTSGNLTEQ
jgi:small-conductance mechanosensitive channel